ncbi:ArsR family transcriptional regulator [bacterium]|nr:MAG: ArsR family transcriptional regulator [bacterium]
MVKFPETDLDRIFGALADPSRRRLVLSLRSGEATVEELGRPLGISTSGVMKHLAVLERSGLITTEKRGRQRFCRLEAERLAAAEEWMAEVRNFWADGLTRLADHLDEAE